MIRELAQWLVTPTRIMTAMLVMGADMKKGAMERPRSIVKMSAETRVINLPELVDMTDSVDS